MIGRWICALSTIALICGIVSGSYAEEQADWIVVIGGVQRISGDIGYFTAPCTYMLRTVVKNIAIAEQSPKIEIFSFLLHFHQIGSLDLNTSSQNRTLGSNKRVKTFICGLEPKIIWNRVISQFPIYIDREIDRWSTAGVCKDGSNSPEVGSWLRISMPMPSDMKIRRENKRSFELDEGGFSYVSRFFRSFEGKPQENCLNSDSHELQKRDNNSGDSQPKRIRVELILGCTVCGLLLGLGLSVLGWKNLYDKRRFIGAALVGCGWLLGGLSLISIWWWPS